MRQIQPGRRISRALASAFLAFSALTLPASAQAPSGGQTLSVVLKPAAADAQGDVPFVDVTETVNVGPAAAGAPLLRLPLVTSNVKTVADNLIDLQARDADGVLPLTWADDAKPATDTAYRRWSAGRPVHGALTLDYRAPITNAPNPRGAAPPLELRTEDGGFSGVSGAFLILPDGDTPYRLNLHWDFSAASAGGTGVSNLGVGDARSLQNLKSKDLESVYFMGGHIHTYPSSSTRAGFFSAWQGQPPFDTAAAMQWTQSLYRFYLKFFKVSDDKPFSVFLRRNPINAGGGVEIRQSFVGTFDDKVKVEDLKFTLAHEMVHTFVGSLDSSELSSSWFSEGLAVYYERVLPLRAGQITPQAFLRDLNSTAGRYYTDALNSTPNAEIDARFWADTRVRVLPYDRGSLYFAALDQKVRAHSNGRRSLDDLMLSMLERRRHGLPMNENAWVETLTAELGPEGKSDFDAMLAGRLVVPPSDSFGPCFARTTAPLRRYELGFVTDVLIEPHRIVRGLKPDSAAAAAGLRDGDEIVKPVPQDLIQSDQTALMHLQVRRDGKVFDITYLPRGETVQAYQWAPTGRCSPSDGGAR
jgi:hypothetical protein